MPACKVQAWEVSQRRRKAEGVSVCSQKRGRGPGDAGVAVGKSSEKGEGHQRRMLSRAL